MNRADRLYSVLKDGRPYSRLEIFERVGFMLTNNAASELRARGVNVEHSIEKGNDIYRLGVLDAPAGTPKVFGPPSPSESGAAGASSTPPSSNPSSLAAGAADGRDGVAGVLSLFPLVGPSRVW